MPFCDCLVPTARWLHRRFIHIRQINCDCSSTCQTSAIGDSKRVSECIGPLKIQYAAALNSDLAGGAVDLEKPISRSRSTFRKGEVIPHIRISHHRGADRRACRTILRNGEYLPRLDYRGRHTFRNIGDIDRHQTPITSRSKQPRSFDDELRTPERASFEIQPRTICHNNVIDRLPRILIAGINHAKRSIQRSDKTEGCSLVIAFRIKRPDRTHHGSIRRVLRHVECLVVQHERKITVPGRDGGRTGVQVSPFRCRRRRYMNGRGAGEIRCGGPIRNKERRRPRREESCRIGIGVRPCDQNKLIGQRIRVEASEQSSRIILNLNAGQRDGGWQNVGDDLGEVRFIGNELRRIIMDAQSKPCAGRPACACIEVIELDRDGSIGRRLLLRVVRLDIDLVRLHESRLEIHRGGQWRRSQQDPALNWLHLKRSPSLRAGTGCTVYASLPSTIPLPAFPTNSFLEIE